MKTHQYFFDWRKVFKKDGNPDIKYDTHRWTAMSTPCLKSKLFNHFSVNTNPFQNFRLSWIIIWSLAYSVIWIFFVFVFPKLPVGSVQKGMKMRKLKKKNNKEKETLLIKEANHFCVKHSSESTFSRERRRNRLRGFMKPMCLFLENHTKYLSNVMAYFATVIFCSGSWEDEGDLYQSRDCFCFSCLTILDAINGSLC